MQMKRPKASHLLLVWPFAGSARHELRRRARRLRCGCELRLFSFLSVASYDEQAVARVNSSRNGRFGQMSFELKAKKWTIRLNYGEQRNVQL